MAETRKEIMNCNPKPVDTSNITFSEKLLCLVLTFFMNYYFVMSKTHAEELKKQYSTKNT